MQKILLALSFLFSTVAANSQDGDLIVAKAGIGIDKLKLGLSEKQVVNLLKGDISWYSYKSEMLAFHEYCRVDSTVQFVMGFDSCAKYMKDLPETLPVFALYFKDHRLNYIKVTSYNADPLHLLQLVFDKDLTFGDATSTCIEKLGTDYVNVRYSDYSGVHYFYKLGIELVYEKGLLAAVGIFPPIPRFKALIREKSAELQRQVAAALEEE